MLPVAVASPCVLCRDNPSAGGEGWPSYLGTLQHSARGELGPLSCAGRPGMNTDAGEEEEDTAERVRRSRALGEGCCFLSRSTKGPVRTPQHPRTSGTVTMRSLHEAPRPHLG